MEKLFRTRKRIVFAVLRFLFSLFPRKEVGEQIITKTEQVPGERINLPKPEEPALFWQILEVLAVIALSAGIILMAVYALKRFLSFVAERMQRRETGLENVTVSM